ncbi:MAG TPA: hypothetical protein VKZ65_04495 [Glycomyces sp.]|nr:hypothetical protein [Glycomyces sp.]
MASPKIGSTDAGATGSRTGTLEPVRYDSGRYAVTVRRSTNDT